MPMDQSNAGFMLGCVITIATVDIGRAPDVVYADQDRMRFVFRNNDASGRFTMPTSVMTHERPA